MMNQNSNKGYSPIFRLANQNDIRALCRIDSVNSNERYQEIVQWVTQDNAYLIEISDTIVAYGIFHSHFFGQNFIELLMVDQQYRRQGLALILIENFKQLRKTPKLFTSTNQSNVATQKLLTQTELLPVESLNISIKMTLNLSTVIIPKINLLVNQTHKN